jgi:hypothetical protein
MSIKGARKRDFPQSLSYHTPWWPYYKPLNDYFGRLSLALSSGQQQNKVLVLEPTTTAWMHFSPSQDLGHLGADGEVTSIAESFSSLLGTFERFQVEYDLGSEALLSGVGSETKGQLTVGNRGYEAVVIPPSTENLDSATVDLLERFMKAGGQIFSLAKSVTRVDGMQSERVNQIAATHPKHWTSLTSPEEVAAHLPRDPAFEVVEPGLVLGKIFHQRRQFSNGQLIFWVNFDTQVPSTVQFQVAGSSISRLDLETGEVIPYPSTAEDGKLEVKVDLPPEASRLFFAHHQGSEFSPNQPRVPTSWEVVETSGTGIQRLAPNVLTLDYCSLTIGAKSFPRSYFYDAAEKVFQTYLKTPYGFNHNPWSIAVQYRNQIVDRNVFPDASGFEATFSFQLEGRTPRESLRLAVERPGLYEVLVNGIAADVSRDERWLDEDFGVFSIGDLVMAGVNEATLVAPRMDVEAELEPVYVLGDFALESAKQGWLIVPPRELAMGSWKDQGMPLYPNTVSYSRAFEAEDVQSRFKVKLGNWQGTVATVSLNGQYAGIVGWPPYELEISEFVRKGNNLVRVDIVGSLKNLLGPHHNNPQRGLVTPWSFFYAPEQQPPGVEYDLIDYGLFSDFEVLVSN